MEMIKDVCIKELKNGEVTPVMKFEGMRECWRFEEVGKKIVAFVQNSNFEDKVVVYENKKLIHTCNNEFDNFASAFVEGSKVYFPSDEDELIEFDSETFEEKALMQNVAMMSKPPDQRGFLAVSRTGVLRTGEGKKELKEVFPRMNRCNWTAVISVGYFAVMAGTSKFSISDGSRLPMMCNYFLLVDPATLEVVNHAHPLSVEWSKESGTSVV